MLRLISIKRGFSLYQDIQKETQGMSVEW